MRVLTTDPIVFFDGDVLAPEDLNGGSLYVKDALIDVSQKRWAHGVMVIPFVVDVGTPYTNAMLGTEELVFRFACPVTCVVERGYLSANMTSAADVQWAWTKTGGGTPTGCTVPWLSTGAAVASSAVDTIDENVDRFVLDAGSEYQLTVTSTGAFTLNRADIILHVAVDRFNTSGTPHVPDAEPTMLVDQPPNATIVNGINTALAAQAALLASNNSGMTPVLFIKHGLLSPTTVTFPIPSFAATRAQCKIKRVYLAAFMASTGGGTITATVKDASAATVLTVTANVAGVTQRSQDSGPQTVAIDAGDASDGTKDLSITFANSSAAVNAVKVYAVVWLARV